MTAEIQRLEQVGAVELAWGGGGFLRRLSLDNGRWPVVLESYDWTEVFGCFTRG